MSEVIVLNAALFSMKTQTNNTFVLFVVHFLFNLVPSEHDRDRLREQLEWYLSPKNLATDGYLGK
jgi:hypothetical protein